VICGVLITVTWVQLVSGTNISFVQLFRTPSNSDLCEDKLLVLRIVSLKAKQSLSGQRVNGEGLWLNSLDYLPVCYTQRSLLTVLYVVCYQSVTRNSNNSSSYVYNRELITQATPISHSPGKFKFWIWHFFLKLMFLVVLAKIF